MDTRIHRRLAAHAGAAILALIGGAVAAAQDPPVTEPPVPGPGEGAALPPPKPDRPISLPGGPPPASPDRIPEDGGREGMWPAPTEADWAKPVLITFQRTWDDALAVSKETGKAILICVNMDGEIASEHYAGVRYRQPDIAALYAPYVCVIASVYRHTPRDHDDEGRRVVCPRFGSVTCGEHITIEPIVYERYLDGRRIAPRHIMVELDGHETYDVYYANDTASIFRTIEDGIAKRGTTPPPVVRGDRPMTERVASRDVEDRVAVEATYTKADATQRRALLDAALAQGAAAPIELLRLAVFGLDVEASVQARKALAQSELPGATDLIVEALRVPMQEAEREALLAALERLGKTSPRAQWLAALHRGLAGKSADVDVGAWTRAAGGAPSESDARDWYGLEQERQDRETARRAKPDDPAVCLELAEASLALGIAATRNLADDPRMARAAAHLLFEDARRGGLQAESLGATGWRVDATVGLASYHRGDTATAYARAEKAVKAMPKGEPGLAAAQILTVFAESRFQSIKQAVKEKRRWPGQWMADVNAAYAVLLEHPLGTDAQVAWHADFLGWLGAFDRARRVLDLGLARFPASDKLHEMLRQSVLRERGVDAVEAEYESRLAVPGAPGSLERFAAFASLRAAEFRQRAGNAAQALESYGRAAGHFERAAAHDPSFRATADRRIAVVLGSQARIALERGDLDASLRDILASFARYPGAASDLDGRGLTPASTAQMLLLRLREAGRADAAERLDAAMKALDPELLRPRNE